MNRNIIHIAIVTAIVFFGTSALKSNINIISPSPTDTLYVGDILTIRWVYPAGHPVDLYYARGSSEIWELISLYVTDDSYNWPVPPVDSSRLRFKAISSRMIEPSVIWADTTQHSEEIKSTSFSDDGNYFLTASKDSYVKIWSIRDRTLIDEYDFNMSGVVYDAKFYRSKDTIIVNSGIQTYLWDRINGDLILLGTYLEEARSLSIHPSKPVIVVGSYDGTANIIDINSKTPLKTYFLPQGERIYTISFSAGGDKIVYGTSEGYVYTAEWETNEPATVLGRHGFGKSPKVVFSTSFSPDGLNVISSGYNGTVRMWDIASQSEIVNFSNHKERVPVRAAIYRPDGNDILSGSLDNTIRQWDPSTGIERHDSMNYEAGVMSIDYSPTGDSILTAGRDNGFKLWRNYFFVNDGDSMSAEVRYKAIIEIPDIVSLAGRKVKIPIILHHNYNLQSILSSSEIKLTVEFPNNLLDLRYFKGNKNSGRYKDTINLSVSTNFKSPDTLDVLKAIALYGNIKKEDINILSYEITYNNLLSIETDDGSIEIEYECGDTENFTFGFSNSNVDIDIRPNPSESYIDIKLNLIEDGYYQADIISMTGEKVFNMFNEKKKHGVENTSLDINFLPSGVYYFRLISPSKIIAKKFSIRR